MKKIINYPDNVHKKLLIKAAKAGKDLTNYIKELLINDVKK